MRFKGSTIFVTGGACFIGSAVVRQLLRDSHARVVNIDKLTYAARIRLASPPALETRRMYAPFAAGAQILRLRSRRPVYIIWSCSES